MRRFFAGLMGLALVCFSHPNLAFAQAHGAVLSDSDAASLAGITRYLNDIRTLKAHFLQIGPTGETSQGTVWLQRPGRMRFQYDPPSPLLLVASQGTVVFHDAKLDQTTTIPVAQTPLGLLLADTIVLTGDVTITDYMHEDGQILITAVRTKSPGDGSLTLLLNAQPMALVGWSVVDAQGQETRVRLSDSVLGGVFDPALFKFDDADEK